MICLEGARGRPHHGCQLAAADGLDASVAAHLYICFILGRHLWWRPRGPPLEKMDRGCFECCLLTALITAAVAMLVQLIMLVSSASIHSDWCCFSQPCHAVSNNQCAYVIAMLRACFNLPHPPCLLETCAAVQAWNIA